MRTPFICGNWKMYKTIREAVDFVEALKPRLAAVQGVEVGIAAPFVQLKSLADAARGSALRIGAQDCYWEEQGAFTGEIAPGMLKDAGASFVVVGHSERRQFFGETNEWVNKKTKAALKAGLSVIVCVGETLQQREQGVTNAVIADHLENGLAGLSEADLKSVVVAYEPVWAIGTGKTATPAQAQETHAFARGVLRKAFGAAAADAMRIQYGGSVKPENVKEIMAGADVDGALVGGAALQVDSFEKLVRYKS